MVHISPWMHIKAHVTSNQRLRICKQIPNTRAIYYRMIALSNTNEEGTRAIDYYDLFWTKVGNIVYEFSDIVWNLFEINATWCRPTYLRDLDTPPD